MESTLKNMVAVLFGITLVASAGVGVVNMITAEPIALSKQAATTAALTEVLPSFDETTSEELTIDEMPITVYTATKGGVVAGYAVQTMTKQGFSGTVRLMVGFDVEGSASEFRRRLLFEKHIFTGGAGATTVRLLPALTLTRELADRFLASLEALLRS